jgi:hypothetical protein
MTLKPRRFKRIPQVGDIRTVSRFALFPVRDDSDKGVWLEWYKAEQILYWNERYFWKTTKILSW